MYKLSGWVGEHSFADEVGIEIEQAIAARLLILQDKVVHLARIGKMQSAVTAAVLYQELDTVRRFLAE